MRERERETELRSVKKYRDDVFLHWVYGNALGIGAGDGLCRRVDMVFGERGHLNGPFGYLGFGFLNGPVMSAFEKFKGEKKDCG